MYLVVSTSSFISADEHDSVTSSFVLRIFSDDVLLFFFFFCAGVVVCCWVLFLVVVVSSNSGYRIVGRNYNGVVVRV